MANPLQEFNDSSVGVYLGSVLHTLGAIAFLGGLVAYLSWHRGLAKGHHHRKVLDGAMALSYLAIVVNLLGGFMRTFESDHPSLEQFGESAWVRAIAIKHVFLFAAMGSSIYLFERMAPRLLKAYKEGRSEDLNPGGHKLAVFLVALGIVVAAILGAVTQVVPLVEASGHDEVTLHSALQYRNATGQLTSTPLAPATSSGSFDVPNGTQQMDVFFGWTPAQSNLRLELRNPNGTAMPVPPASNGAIQFQMDQPPLGAWTYTVSSNLATGVTWTLSARLEMLVGGEPPMEHGHDHADA